MSSGLTEKEPYMWFSVVLVVLKIGQHCMCDVCSLLQIVHLKRFQFVNGRWIKSQKIVKFPRENFDPSAFLAPRDLEQHCLHSRSESEDLLRVGEDNLSSISAPAGFYNLPKGTTC